MANRAFKYLHCYGTDLVIGAVQFTAGGTLAVAAPGAINGGDIILSMGHTAGTSSVQVTMKDPFNLVVHCTADVRDDAANNAQCSVGSFSGEGTLGIDVQHQLLHERGRDRRRSHRRDDVDLLPPQLGAAGELPEMKPKKMGLGELMGMPKKEGEDDAEEMDEGAPSTTMVGLAGELREALKSEDDAALAKVLSAIKNHEGGDEPEEDEAQ